MEAHGLDARSHGRLVLRDAADVVGLVEQEIAPVDQIEDHLAGQKEIAGMMQKRFPFAQGFRRRMQSCLVVDPGVVHLSVEERAFESLDDLELRIDTGFDRILPKQRLTERMDRLRFQPVDARQLLRAGTPNRVLLFRSDFEQRLLRVGRPADPIAFELQLHFGHRALDAICDLSCCLFGEGHQDDAFRRQLLVPQQQLQHLGDDGGGFPGACAGLDHNVPPRRNGGFSGRREAEHLLLRSGHGSFSSRVRGSFCRTTAYRSTSSCFVRQE